MQRPRKMEHAEDLNVTQKQMILCYLRQLLEQCNSIHLAPITQCNVCVFDVKLALQQNQLTDTPNRSSNKHATLQSER